MKLITLEVGQDTYDRWLELVGDRPQAVAFSSLLEDIEDLFASGVLGWDDDEKEQVNDPS